MISIVPTGPLGVNTLVVPLCGSYVFIVDPACCPSCGDEEKLLSFIKQASLIPVAVVLTHGHFDHIAGARFVKEQFNIPLFISREDSVCIGKEGENFQEESLRNIGFSSFLNQVENLPEPDGFLEEGKTLLEVYPEDFSCINENEELKEKLSNWKVLLTPGHTEGSVCLYNKEEKLLISGDTVFYRSWGRTDLPGGSEAQIQKSLKRLYSEIPADTKVYPGHDYTGFSMYENFGSRY